MTTFLSQLKQQAHSQESTISPMVWANAKYLSQLFDESSEEFQFLTALTTFELERGNTCVNIQSVTNPRQWPNHPLSQFNINLTDSLQYLEKKQGQWLQQHYVAPLRSYRGRLYLDKQFQLERQVASWICDKIDVGMVASLDYQQIEALSDRYFAFNKGETLSVDWQKVAAVMALTRKFTVITGGPGTGKTTTVTRMLAMLFESPKAWGFASTPKVVLAAPTGKAKNRMAESIRNQLEITNGAMALPAPVEIKDALRIEPQTIHRLIQVNPTKEHPRFNKYNKLDCDICIIDEGSMIDLERIDALMNALPSSSSLIILADKDQLASVDAGAVIANLCTPILPLDGLAKSIGVSGHSRELLERTAGASFEPWLRNDNIALSNHVISLQKSHRFNEQTGIGILANSVNNADVIGAKRAFSEFDDVNWVSNAGTGDLYATGIEQYESYHNLVKTASPEVAFKLLGKQIILTSKRQGKGSSKALNNAISRHYSDGQSEPWFHGMPVMITENAYRVGLFNGDIGLVLPDANGTLKACFQNEDGVLRYFSKHRLPAFSTAYALTIHKSQGSEWDNVIVALSSNLNLENKELLYTGLTRAKNVFTLISSEEAMASAIRRKSQRSSGLFEEIESRTKHG